MKPGLALLLLLLLSAGCSEPKEQTPAGQPQARDTSAAGRLAFVRCRACHSIQAGDAHKVGPNLSGFMGRQAGAAQGYQYSDELVASGLSWDSATLAAWITDPAFTVPGTTMVYANDLTGDEIGALIGYLTERTTVAP